MSELFYKPLTPTPSESEVHLEWSPSLIKSISLPLNEKATSNCKPVQDMNPNTRMSALFYQPTGTQNCFERPPSLTKSISLPLKDSEHATPGTQGARHDGGQSRMCHAEHKDLMERFERLNSLSAVIERKLQEQKERKTLRLICLLTSEAMHGVKMI